MILPRDDDDDDDFTTKQWISVVVPICIAAGIGFSLLVIWHRRRWSRRQRVGGLSLNQHGRLALERDVEAHTAPPYDLERHTQTAFSRRLPHTMNRWAWAQPANLETLGGGGIGNRRGHEEGLNELGEAPPPYDLQKNSEAANVEGERAAGNTEPQTGASNTVHATVTPLAPQSISAPPSAHISFGRDDRQGSPDSDTVIRIPPGSTASRPATARTASGVTDTIRSRGTLSTTILLPSSPAIPLASLTPGSRGTSPPPYSETERANGLMQPRQDSVGAGAVQDVSREEDGQAEAAASTARCRGL